MSSTTNNPASGINPPSSIEKETEHRLSSDQNTTVEQTSNQGDELPRTLNNEEKVEETELQHHKDGNDDDLEKASPPPGAGGPGDHTFEPEASRTKFETFVIMLALGIALFLAALDMTITTTAVPTIAAHFNSPSGYVWVGSAYLLGVASCVPVWGKLSDIFGRKQVLLMAVAVFFVGSLLCAVSVSMGMLIASRAIQGIGGGGVVTLPNICVSDLFSIRKRGQYFGMLGGVWAIASAIGPILGGVFTEKVTWRWCFYINLPLSGTVFFVLIFMLKLHNPRTPIREGLKAIDWVGSLLIVGATLMLLLGLEFGGTRFPWDSATTICLIIFGFVTIGVAAVYEWKVAKYPILPIHIFKYSNSVAAYGCSFLHAMTFMSGSYWLPVYFQGVVGSSTLLSGVYLLPFVLALSLTSVVSGVAIKKTGNFQVPIVAGMVVMALGFGLFIDLGPKADWAKIIIFQIIAGMGVGPNFQAPLIALQTNVEPRDIGSATASFSFIRQIGTSISVVIGGVIFDNKIQSQHATLQRELPASLAKLLTGSNAIGSVQLVGKLTGHEGEVARGAFWNSLKLMYIVYTAVGGVAVLVGLSVRQTKLKETHSEHKTGLQSLRQRTDAVAADENETSEEKK